MPGNWNVWQHGNRFPPANEPCKDDREERDYDFALTNPNRCYGLGTKDDPLVIWLNSPGKMGRDAIWAHNNFAKAIAKLLGLTHTWMIRGAHDQQYARDEEGRKILASPGRWLLREADMHITLRLGTGLYECRLSAHAYVALGESGSPERYMDELTRRFREKDSDVQIDFWQWGIRRRRFLPRRGLQLGENWELYANVGPYLDTYRPDRRRTRDTYTPRDKDTPPREHDGGEVLEGAMTPELAALVHRCHAAYDVYKNLHEELAALEDRPDHRMRELHAMREQIVTMKREIYREAKGYID
ncbi:hypothetical protein F4861DRAFT_49231 [Xylaria intraflava]|nr:hypothetical protein F4861DRAFT_49231 [Xylaria intraflava]